MQLRIALSVQKIVIPVNFLLLCTCQKITAWLRLEGTVADGIDKAPCSGWLSFSRLPRIASSWVLNTLWVEILQPLWATCASV